MRDEFLLIPFLYVFLTNLRLLHSSLCEVFWSTGASHCNHKSRVSAIHLRGEAIDFCAFCPAQVNFLT